MLSAGTAGDPGNRSVAQQLLAPPDWGLLAVPLVRNVRTIVDATTTSIKGDPKQHLLCEKFFFRPPPPNKKCYM